MKLKLADIRIDGGTQSRVAINTGVVADYANAMREGEQLPPLLVFFDGAAHWLADGFHRFHASRKVGLSAVEVELVQGTLQDAKLHAYGANKSHGLRRTNEDKRKAVLGMLADFGAWSDNKIAKHVGVSNSTVSLHRLSLCDSQSEKPVERTYTTKHGTEATMNTGGIGKNKPTPPAAANRRETPPDAANRRDQEPQPYNAEDGAPSLEELLEADKVIEQEQEAMRRMLEADDKLAEALAMIKQRDALVEQLSWRINALTNENAELIRSVKYWRRQAEKAAA